MAGTRNYQSIGEVLVSVKTEFPDITISKIRFLESQGLLDPERTPSGYRKFYETDVADAAAARRTVADLLRRRGRLDLLVLAAGICRDAVLWKMTDEAWSRVIDVDLSGAAHVLRAAARSAPASIL